MRNDDANYASTNAVLGDLVEQFKGNKFANSIYLKF